MFQQLNNSGLTYIYWKFPQGTLGVVPLMCCSSLGSCCICQWPSPRPSLPTPLPWTRSPPRNRRLLRSFRLIINESWLVYLRTKYWVSSIPTVQTMPWQSDPNWNSRAICKMMMLWTFSSVTDLAATLQTIYLCSDPRDILFLLKIHST